MVVAVVAVFVFVFVFVAACSYSIQSPIHYLLQAQLVFLRLSRTGKL